MYGVCTHTCPVKHAHSRAQGEDEEDEDSTGDDFSEPEEQVSERGGSGCAHIVMGLHGARAVGQLVPPPMPLGRNRPSCARNAQAAEEQIINKPKRKLPKPAAQTSGVRQPAKRKVPLPS